MKKLYTLILAAIIAASVCSCSISEVDTALNDPQTETALPIETYSVDQKVKDMVSGMSLNEKVWQMFMVAPEDIVNADPVIAAGDITKSAIETYPIGGIILFGKNIETTEQLTEMISNMQSYSKIPLFMAVDEEGGRVARLGNSKIGFVKFPPMAEIGAENNSNKAYEIGETLGRELGKIGFNVDFAPVADTITVENNDDIGDRSFGEDPTVVASMVEAEVKGMKSQDLCSTLKHFPSNGSTETNTHYVEGVCTRTIDEMRETEFVPFKAGIDAGADMIMVSHMAVPNITGDTTPSTLSPIVIKDLLRDELGFNGVVVSDALNMGAITSNYTPSEAVINAINAGVDIVLMSPDVVSAANDVVNAVNDGRISEEELDDSVERILKLKIQRKILYN